LAIFALALYLLYRTARILHLTDEGRHSSEHEHSETVFQSSEQ
jgi:hypothetical protein